MPDEPLTYTIAEAAQLAGHTRKAIRSRVDRGSLPHVLRDGVRRIPRRALVDAGLIDPAGAPIAAGAGHVPRQGSPDAPMVAELLDRLERQAGELAQLRLLTEQSESTIRAERQAVEQAQAEVFELRARVAELEASRRPWWRRRGASQGNPEPPTA